MSKWVQAMKRADFGAIADKFGISPVLARIIRNRDITTDEEYWMYLRGGLSDLHDARSMMDMVKACSIIQQYISEGKTFRIIGDYDIDGICATYILLKGLRRCGADVDYAIPHRVTDGYGLNISLVESAHTDGREVIITCDNGIAAAEQIAYANELGMHVIVTDHHEVPYETTEDGERIELLPPAEAIVDPHRECDNYPYPGICGAVVAWKLIGVLLPMCGVPENEAEALMLRLLEEAAIATVGDVMELCDENRIIVKEGLARLQSTQNLGLSALIRATGLSDKRITAYHIGFVIGPCLNATGRLDSATRALELLECQDDKEAAILANELVNLNNARKDMTERGVVEAIEDIENSVLSDDRILVVYLPKIHESLAGIIAGRLRERYEKPTIVFTDAVSSTADENDPGVGEETQLIKGSGRSVEAYNMFEGLSEVKHLFTKFGGHKMAAGISMPYDNLDELRVLLNQNCTLTEEDLTTKTVIDVALPMSYVTESFIEELNLLEPFGNGNSKPIFAQRNLNICRVIVRGRLRNLMLLEACDESGGRYELKMFNCTDEFCDAVDANYGTGVSGDLIDGSFTDGSGPVRMNVIYYPGINEFRGVRTLEYIVNDYMFCSLSDA